MSFTLNPFTGNFDELGGGVNTYTNLAAFPVSSFTGDLGVAQDTGFLYEWNGSAWVAIGGPGSVLSIGSPANGLSITGDALSLALATSSLPGAVANIGSANGVATLDSGGHVPLTQLPSTLVEYLGTWNASTNTPTLANGTGVSGQFYITSTGGTVNFGAGNITFNSGDWVLYNGSIWERAVQSNIVQSVNGQTGVVTINAINQLTSDVTAGPASGSASAAATIAAIQGKTVSGTTGTTNVMFSASPTTTGTLTTAAITASGEITANGSGTGLSVTNTANILGSLNVGPSAQFQVSTGGTITSASLTASEAVVTDGSKNLVSMAYTSLNTGSTICSRDVNGNTAFNNVIITTTITATSGQTIAMTAGSGGEQIVTGSSNIAFNLPVATNLFVGEFYRFNNNSTGTVSVYKTDGSTLVGTIAAGGLAETFCTDNTTSNGTWDLHPYFAHTSTSGTSGTSIPGTFTAASTVQGTQLISTVSTGTAPLTVTSTTQVANLNAATAGSFTGSLAGDVSGTQSATVLANTLAGNKIFTGTMQSGGTATTQALNFAHNVSVGSPSYAAVSYGGNPTYSGVRANGTEASPTAVTNTQILSLIEGGGYDGTAWSQVAAKITMLSAEAWAVGAHGTNMLFSTTATGTTAVNEQMRITSAGNLLVGNTTGTSLLSVGSSAQLTVDTSGNLATSGTITSTVSTGTAPFVIASTTPVANLVAGGNLYLNAGDINETSFAAANNISSATNVTGLAFANASVRSAKVFLSVYINATSSLYESFELNAIQRGADWQMSQTSVGDASGFVFTITTAGQVQYTSPNASGFVSAAVRFRALVTST